MDEGNAPGSLLGPLKVIACNGSYQDPAVDADPTQLTVDVFSRYIRTADPDVLPIRHGCRPTTFELHRLPVQYLALLSSYTTPERQKVAALLGSLRRVVAEGAPPLVEVLPPRPAPPEGSRWVGEMVEGCIVAPAALAQELCDTYTYETVLQLGHWALEFSRLRKGDRGPFSWWGTLAARR
jgi:hypothetical protein